VESRKAIAELKKSRKGGLRVKPKGMSEADWLEKWNFSNSEVAIESDADEERIKEVLERLGLDYPALAGLARSAVANRKPRDLPRFQKSPSMTGDVDFESETDDDF
jgi:hypothetical protein